MLQPYQIGDVTARLSQVQNSYWRSLLENEFSRFTFQSDSLNSALSFKFIGGERISMAKDHSRGRYFVSGEAYWSLPSFVLVNRTVVDESFSDDPFYVGTTSKWATARIEDSYVLGNFKSLTYSFGRLSRNWGLPDQYGLMLSDHPYSYDHLSLTLNTDHFTYSFFTSRLDDLQAKTHEFPDTLIYASKYMTAHRLDLAIGKKLQLGISESVVYGGPNRHFEFVYINPVGFYFESQLNLDIEANGQWSVEALYRPNTRTTFYGQFLFDDIIINDQPGKDYRGQFPDRIGYSLNSIFTDLLFGGTLLSLNYTRVSNWTYQSARTWENYLYKGKSLGYPSNSSESFRLEVAYFGAPPFIFGVNYRYSRTGKQNLGEVFLPIKHKFPMGIVERGHFIEMDCFYVPSKAFYLDARLKWENYQNKYSSVGENRSGFSLYLNLFASIAWVWNY